MEPTLKERGFYHWPVWRRARKLALQRDHYLCQLRLRGCTRLATEVHHIKPVDQAPELALSLDNRRCHEQTKQRGQKKKLPPVRVIKA